MRNLNLASICILLSLLTACGGVGTEKRSKKGPKTVAQIELEIKRNKSCSPETEASLESVAELCAADLTVDLNRNLCLVEARTLKTDNPNFVCSLEDGSLVDADYLQENFITKVETQKDKIERSGIFDE